HEQSPYRVKTLFATHYHELNSMCMHFSRIKNFNVSVKEHNNNIIFLRRLKEGGSAHSFGIHVAKMAGMPESVIRDAQLKLQELERHHHSESFQTELQWAPANDYSPAVNDASDAALELRAALLALNLNHISPMDALLILQDWQKNHLDT
ncbi:MAG: MutS-related protein, partial [Bacteroidia bacterium]